MLPGKKFGLADIAKIARRRLWLIVIPPAITTMVALVYSSTIPNVYQSDMLIAIDPQRVPDAFVRSTVTLATDLRVEAITVQVLSRTALQQMIETLDLYKVERQTMPLEDVVARMRSNIQIRLERPRPQWGQPASPTAFHVLFTYPDPQMATQVTQLIGSRYVAQNVRDRGALAGATNRFLESQLEESRSKLAAQERALEAFRQRHGPELPTQMQYNMQSQMNAQMQAQTLAESLARDRDRRQMLDRLYREALNDPAPPPSVPTGGQGDAADETALANASFRQQLTAARENLERLERRYRPEHPDVTRARRLIAELEPKAADEAAAASRQIERPADAPREAIAGDAVRRESLRQMQAEIESLSRQIAFKESEERRVRTEVDEFQRRLEAVPGLESQWTALTRDYETLQANYRDLLAKSSAAQLSLNLEEQEISERFRIVDPAGVPVRPLPAVRARVNAAGLAIGLLLGLAIVALLELRDASFRSDTDVIDSLALPVLATVPSIQTRADRQRSVRRRWAYSAAGVAYLTAAGYLTWSLRLWNSLL